jgi:hypothetical protein
MRYTEIIQERQEKNTSLALVMSAAKKAKDQLSYEAKDAIQHWQSSGWDTGPLEKSFRANNEISEEITETGQLIRDALQSAFGSTITLYRGQRNYEQHELTANRILFSWTSDSRVATAFAHNEKLTREISDEEIKQAIDQYDRLGWCKFGTYRYKKINDAPGYYMIYGGRQVITDGDEATMEEDFKRDQAERAAYNKRVKEKGQVIKADVPVDLVVWVTNDLNCKEFIVKLNPHDIQ